MRETTARRRTGSSRTSPSKAVIDRTAASTAPARVRAVGCAVGLSIRGACVSGGGWRWSRRAVSCGRVAAATDDDADREQRNGGDYACKNQTAASMFASEAGMLTSRPGIGYLTVRPRFSKNATIAGAAPTRKAASAEMSVPRRPIEAWW